MAKIMSYEKYIKRFEDLVTAREQVRAGFIALALEKNYLAVPYIEEAKALRVLTEQVRSVNELLETKVLYPSLLSASGLSVKALRYLTDTDKIVAIQGLIDEFLAPAGNQFVDQLVYRYLLTKGDALGGKARNLTGTLGERKFIRTLLALFNVYQITYYWMDNETYLWHQQTTTDVNLERRIKALSWTNKKGNRVLVLNVNVPIVKKNIDISLLDGHYEALVIKGKGAKKSIHRDNSKYLVLGELKGGIDPSGADEHWKTANTALNRIRNSFQKINQEPHTFFIGAAIEPSMAQEIFEQLKSKSLTNAANLTIDQQLFGICDWLVQI